MCHWYISILGCPAPITFVLNSKETLPHLSSPDPIILLHNVPYVCITIIQSHGSLTNMPPTYPHPRPQTDGMNSFRTFRLYHWGLQFGMSSRERQQTTKSGYDKEKLSNLHSDGWWEDTQKSFNIIRLHNNS